MPCITKRHQQLAEEYSRKKYECAELYSMLKPLNDKVATLRGVYYRALEELCRDLNVPNYGEIGEMDKVNALRELGVNIH